MRNKMSIDQLLKAMENEFGGQPIVMQKLSRLHADAVFEHAENKNFAMGGDKIPAKYKLLMSISVAAATGSENCTKTYTQVARNKGISKEEIMEAILLARFIVSSEVVSTAHDAMHLMLEENK